MRDDVTTAVRCCVVIRVGWWSEADVRGGIHRVVRTQGGALHLVAAVLRFYRVLRKGCDAVRLNHLIIV